MIVRSREPLLLLLVNAVAVTLSRRLELVEIRRINATLGRIIYPTDSIDPTFNYVSKNRTLSAVSKVFLVFKIS